MIVDAKDLKWYITDTVKNDKLTVKYNYNDKWFDNVLDIIENDKNLVDLGDIVVSPDTQIVKVYLRRVLPTITLQNVIKECNNHKDACEGCPFFRLRNNSCAFYMIFPCSWEKALEDCGYRLEE